MRVVVGVERSDVAPVGEVALARADDLAVREVPHAGLTALDELGDDVAAEVVGRRLVGSVARDRVDQDVGGEDVVPHRREHLAGRLGHPDRVLRLLAKGADRARVRIGLDHAELAGASRSGRGCPATVMPGAERDVLLDHLARIHAVDVVGAEDADVPRPLVVDEVQVLVDRVGRAGEPARAATHLRRHRGDVVAEERREAPGRRDVAVEAVALVLRQHADLQLPRVDEVREREVDQPVVAAEGNGRLRPIGRERREALALHLRPERLRRPASCACPQRIGFRAVDEAAARLAGHPPGSLTGNRPASTPRSLAGFPQAIASNTRRWKSAISCSLSRMIRPCGTVPVSSPACTVTTRSTSSWPDLLVEREDLVDDLDRDVLAEPVVRHLDRPARAVGDPALDRDVLRSRHDVDRGRRPEIVVLRARDLARRDVGRVVRAVQRGGTDGADLARERRRDGQRVRVRDRR